MFKCHRLYRCFERHNIKHLLAKVSNEYDRFVSLLNCPVAHWSLSAEVLSRQQRADNI
jgi:hypothetical protein